MKKVTLKLCGTMLGLLGFASCGSTKGLPSDDGDEHQNAIKEKTILIEPSNRIRVMYGPNPSTYIKIEETSDSSSVK